MAQKGYTKGEIQEFVEKDSSCKFNDTYMEKTKHGSKRVLNLTCSCGDDFEVLWVKFNRIDGKKQRQCRKCGLRARGESQRITDEEYTRRKAEKGITIEHLEEPKGRAVGIRHRCPVCGDEDWEPTPANILFKKSTKCTKCHLNNIGGHNKLTDADYQKLKQENGIKIKNIEPYKDYSTNIKHICPDCYKEWLVAPSRILSRNSERCESCSYIRRGENAILSDEQVNKIIKQLDCEWIEGKYEGKKSVLTLKCQCGNPFKKTWSDFRHSWNRCPKCMKSISTGENEIKKWLIDKHIPFIHQQKFDDLRGKRNMPLSYDFGIFDKNGQLKCLVEYDGEYHFKPILTKSSTKDEAENRLKEVQKRDRKKDEYARRNKIPLIRLSAKQYQKLDEYLGHLL